MLVDALVEGLTDEAVARRLIAYAGHSYGATYGRRGVSYLREKAAGFNVRATYGNPILMLVDFMDTGVDCPPQVPAVWLQRRSPNFLLRVVVRELESWILADRNGIARFLGLSISMVPQNPESLPDPKQTLVNLARPCRRRARREALVPQEGIPAAVGPGYVAEIEGFVLREWNIDVARQYAPSLDRCLTRLHSLEQQTSSP